MLTISKMLKTEKEIYLKVLTRAPLGYFYNAPHWGGGGGGYFEPPLWSPKLLGRF